MDRLRVLIIDDNNDLVDDLIQSIGQAYPEFICCGCENFEKARVRLSGFRPHIVILDLFEGNPSDDDNRGEEVLDYIWTTLFRPIIVYSAEPNSIPTVHPLVKKIQKGTDGVPTVISEIDNLRSVITAITDAESHIKKKFAEALRDVAPPVYESLGGEHEHLTETIMRTSRRRLAASMDQQTESAKLAAWEIYLCPPIGESSLQLGDVLVKTVAEDDTGSENQANPVLDPTNFFVVLTPSCDLVDSQNQSPKVSSILASRCCSAKFLKENTKFRKSSKDSFKKGVKSEVLTTGHFREFVPLPSFYGKIPTMMANFRDLCLIPVDDVGEHETGRKYARVASIDSPFREMIAWVYSNFTGRPGLPDRDFDNWAAEIVTSALSKGGDS